MSTTLCTPRPAGSPAPSSVGQPGATGATYVVFSGELDKLLMAFTMANAAAASGLPTTMFFTFWSLPALRTRKPARGKSLVERLFGWMLPKGPGALRLSRMHMAGLGTWMIRARMRALAFAPLEELIASARALGVRFVVCETSMSVMGLRREEMLEGVEYAGAAECVASSHGAGLAMVI